MKKNIDESGRKNEWIDVFYQLWLDFEVGKRIRSELGYKAADNFDKNLIKIHDMVWCILFVIGGYDVIVHRSRGYNSVCVCVCVWT